MTAPLPTSRLCWRLLRSDPAAFFIGWLMWVGFHASPVAVGWVVKIILDRLSEGSTDTPWALLGVLVGIEAGRWILFAAAAVQWHGCWVGWQTVPRVNLLHSLSTGSGPLDRRLPGSPGEAVSRFRDDTQDVALVLDGWLDISGSVLSAGIAIAIMAAISPLAAVAVVIPVAIAFVAALAFGPRLREWRRRSREAAGVVTGFIGDTFGSILAVKTGGAEAAATARFAEHNSTRAGFALRDNVGSEFVRSLGYGTGEIAVGVVLLFVAASLRRGELSAGDIALFASYVTVIAGLAKWAGRLTSYHLQAEVSAGRLAALARDGSRAAVVAPTTTHLRHGPPPMAPPSPAATEFSDLAVEGLTVRHRGSDKGVTDIDLQISAGELVVVTGRVGSGKTTLLRGMLGLTETLGGEVRWNGTAVDPALILVPPRVAYVPQVPRLFSESLADTILLGRGDETLETGLWHACLEDDISVMEDGIHTVVGPRGLRLSGGQVQRTGAARAFVRRPQLLVVDDLSSALDVETEHQLWERLRADRPPAALIVSHRATVFDLADRVLWMEDGRLRDRAP